MTKFKHTPGPWTMFDDCISFVIAKDVSDPVFKYKRIGMFFNDTETMDENLANQRLVMCSPEMIEMLIDECMCGRCEQYDHYCYKCIGNKKRVLIERALGKNIKELLS